jgi:hypothetical protein
VVDPGRRPRSGLEVRIAFPHEELRRPRSNFESTAHQLAQGGATTDLQGRFRFEGLPADVAIELKALKAVATEVDWTVRMRDPLAEMEVWLDPGEQRKFEWVVGGRAHLRGRVVGTDAAPIAEASVAARGVPQTYGVTTKTNGAGEFELDAAATGEVVLRVAPKDGRHSSAELLLHLAAGERRDDVVVVLPAAAPLVVRALDPDGEPTPPGQAQVWSAVDRRTYVDSNRGESESERAKIRLESVPLGDVVVRVDQFASGGLAGAEVAFHHDGERECIVKLESAASVAGSIVDALDAELLVAATVTLLRRREGTHFDFQVAMQSMAQPGLFQFDWLASGAYDFIAASDDGRVGVVAGVTLGAGERRTGIAIPVARAATLELTAPAHSESLAIGERCTFEVRRGDVRVGIAAAPPLGRAHLNVPPGRLTIELRGSSGVLGVEEVDARAGQLTRVRF